MMDEITIPVDAEVARAYHQAPPEVQRKFQLILNLWLRELVASPLSLQAIMDEVSRRAQERGLTPEILESLLNDE